jgi:hypothetical protein
VNPGASRQTLTSKGPGKVYFTQSGGTFGQTQPCGHVGHFTKSCPIHARSHRIRLSRPCLQGNSHEEQSSGNRYGSLLI